MMSESKPHEQEILRRDCHNKQFGCKEKIKDIDKLSRVCPVPAPPPPEEFQNATSKTNEDEEEIKYVCNVCHPFATYYFTDEDLKSHVLKVHQTPASSSVSVEKLNGTQAPTLPVIDSTIQMQIAEAENLPSIGIRKAQSESISTKLNIRDLAKLYISSKTSRARLAHRKSLGFNGAPGRSTTRKQSQTEEWKMEEVGMCMSPKEPTQILPKLSSSPKSSPYRKEVRTNTKGNRGRGRPPTRISSEIHFCPKCLRRYTTEPGLRYHITMKRCYKYMKSSNEKVPPPAAPKPFVCNEKGCERSFSSKECLTFHLMRHKRGNSSRIILPSLNKLESATKTKSGIEFSRKKLQERNLKCTFKDCNTTFKKKRYLSQHIKLHRDKELGIRYGCIFCGNDYSCKKSLQAHKSQKHKNEDLKHDVKSVSMILEHDGRKDDEHEVNLE